MWPSASFLQYNINTRKAFILFIYLFIYLFMYLFIYLLWLTPDDPKSFYLMWHFFLEFDTRDRWLPAREKKYFAMCDSSTVPTATNKSKSVILIKK